MDDETGAANEVLIAGAGPVGLGLALELQRFRIRFRIVEKKAERSTTSKALGLQPRLSEVFAILGIAGKFFARLYGAQGSFLYLVRPDGHVALFQRRLEANELARYLKKIRSTEVVARIFGE